MALTRPGEGATKATDVAIAYHAADYCAYPVSSVEAGSERASITEGLRDADDPEDDRVSDR
jgi:hypothetical protein